MRRFGDVIIASVLLAIMLPLMAFVALAIKLESHGPVLVRQPVHRLGGGRVQILKFRTTGNAQAPDAGLTHVGSFLTYTRLEDLPQLFNVLRGELTLFAAGPNRARLRD